MTASDMRSPRRWISRLSGSCAERAYSLLRHQAIEPGTKEAFNGYVACLRQLYQMGMAVQLKRMGYHMTLLGS